MGECIPLYGKIMGKIGCRYYMKTKDRRKIRIAFNFFLIRRDTVKRERILRDEL